MKMKNDQQTNWGYSLRIAISVIPSTLLGVVGVGLNPSDRVGLAARV